jgi:plastocyanin
MMPRSFTAALAAALVLSTAGGSLAAGNFEATVVIKDHRFEPAEIKVPIATRVELSVVNQDATPEEFESHQLRVEKVIPGGSTGIVRFGPLAPGTYPFFGEFNEATAQGSVVVE